MKNWIIVISVFTLSGCFEQVKDELHEKAKTMVCSNEQIKSVNEYIKVCGETGYFETHCFDMAVTTLCKDTTK